jgi:hypothetical protein
LNAADATYILYKYGGASKGFVGVAGASSDIISGAAAGDLTIRAEQKMLFATGGGTERMRITSGGNLTFNPNSIAASVYFNINRTNGYDGHILLQTNNSNDWQIASDNTANSRNLYFYSYGLGAPALMLRRSDGLLFSKPTYDNTTASAANIVVFGDGSFYRSTSSLKYKTDILDYTKGLSEVMKLRPVSYKGKNDGDKIFAGLIAEEVHDLGLTEFVQYANDNTPDALSYSHMVALLTKAIQELKAEIDTLKK